jgi:transcriptional regulator with XRE-family HTH domain
MQAQSVFPKTVVYSADMAGRPTTKPAPAFGQRLAALRKQKGWTQAELAARLGSTVKMVTYYEREAENPTHKTIESIAKVFGVPASEFMSSPATGKSNAQKPGPASRLQQLTQRLSTLPRQKQKIVIEMLEGFLQKTGS